MKQLRQKSLARDYRKQKRALLVPQCWFFCLCAKKIMYRKKVFKKKFTEKTCSAKMFLHKLFFVRKKN